MTLPRPKAPSRVPWQGSDEQLLQQLREGSDAAAAVLYDRFERDVDRLLWRMLGADVDHDDLVNEAFLSVFRDIGQVRDATRLRSWVIGVAVNAARRELRRRKMRRRFFRPTREAEEFRAVTAQPEARRLLAQAFSLLDRLPVAERMVFVLRHIDARPLQECADLCDCSLATVKRRLTKAERRFQSMAQDVPEVLARLQQGSRWKKS